MKRWIVRLEAEERSRLEQLVRKGKTAAYKIRHAHVLLAVDESGAGPGLPDAQRVCDTCGGSAAPQSEPQAPARGGSLLNRQRNACPGRPNSQEHRPSLALRVRIGRPPKLSRTHAQLAPTPGIAVRSIESLR